MRQSPRCQTPWQYRGNSGAEDALLLAVMYATCLQTTAVKSVSGPSSNRTQVQPVGGGAAEQVAAECERAMIEADGTYPGFGPFIRSFTVKWAHNT